MKENMLFDGEGVSEQGRKGRAKLPEYKEIVGGFQVGYNSIMNGIRNGAGSHGYLQESPPDFQILEQRDNSLIPIQNGLQAHPTISSVVAAKLAKIISDVRQDIDVTCKGEWDDKQKAAVDKMRGEYDNMEGKVLENMLKKVASSALNDFLRLVQAELGNDLDESKQGFLDEVRARVGELKVVAKKNKSQDFNRLEV